MIKIIFSVLLAVLFIVPTYGFDGGSYEQKQTQIQEERNKIKELGAESRKAYFERNKKNLALGAIIGLYPFADPLHNLNPLYAVFVGDYLPDQYIRRPIMITFL